MLSLASRPRDSIGLYWTDEEIIMSLEGMEKGSAIPENVLVDVNPYQSKPSNLPDGFWYLLRSNDNKISKHGFWRARGEATEIFMNSSIIGWRTTLEFYDHYEGRTNWVIQEYRITHKRLCINSNPKESSLLCRVFHSSEGSAKIAGGNRSHPKTPVVPKSGSTTGLGCMSESQARNRDDNTGPLAAPGALPIIPLENVHDIDCISRGDYLELDDLADPGSRSSSSDNTSCLTLTSDECFDSLALLKDLEDVINRDELRKDDDVKFSVAASVRPNEVVVPPANLGSLIRSDGAEPVDKKSLDQRISENAIRSKKTRNWNEGTSNCHDVPTSSSHTAIPEREKKDVTGKKKKLKKYLCFMPF